MGCMGNCNWTSFVRGDDEIVPVVEHFRQEKDCQPRNLQELQDFAGTLETGDCLLMHCTHKFGKITQLMTGSPWDHVALVVRLPTNDPEAIMARIALVGKAPQPISSTMPWPKPGEQGPVEVFEAMGGGAYSYPFAAHAICRGKFFKYVAVRRLRHSQTGAPLGEDAQRKLQEFVQSYWGRPYEQGRAGMLELARPVFHRNPNIQKKRNKRREKLDNLFCSELVTEAYQAAGILPEETLNSNEILPSMFGPGKTIDKYLQVESHGFKLGEVEIFKGPQTPLSKAINETRASLKSQVLQHDENIQEEHSMTPN